MEAKAVVSQGMFRLELEGSEEFVSRHLEAWADKMPSNASVGAQDPEDAEPSSSQVEQAGAKAGDGQRRAKRPAKGGPSCASRIRDLADEGFFSSPRKAGEIADRLKEKATPYEGKHISAALIHTVQSGKLRRVKDGGLWAYVNP